MTASSSKDAATAAAPSAIAGGPYPQAAKMHGRPAPRRAHVVAVVAGHHRAAGAPPAAASVASRWAGSGLRAGKLSPPPIAAKCLQAERPQQPAGRRLRLVGAHREPPARRRQRASAAATPGRGARSARWRVIGHEVGQRRRVGRGAAGGEGAARPAPRRRRRPSRRISGGVNGGKPARRHQPVQRGGEVRRRCRPACRRGRAAAVRPHRCTPNAKLRPSIVARL